MSNKSIVPFIREQFPKYILESSSLFPDFLEAYYEWANLNGNFQSTSYDLQDVNNVDLSYSKFLEDFTNEYLDGIPTEVLVNKQLLIKKISELYEAKGTPKAVQFLLRILYNVDSTIFYPSTQVFKASDAKWNRDVSVRFTLDSGSINSTSTQTYATITYDNRVIDVIILKIVSVAGVSGLYEAFLDVKYNLNIDSLSSPKLNTDSFVGSLVKTTTSKTINSRGKHFLVGDIFDISGASGSGTKIKVTKVDSNSGLSGFQIIQFGTNFSANFIATIEPTSKSILSEVDTNPLELNAYVEFQLGYVLEYPGFYSTNVGFPSDASYIHDGEYYQQFSYVVKSEVDGVKYEKPLELIHPAGLKPFSEYIIENSVDINVEIATILNKINSKIQDFIAISDEMYIVANKPMEEDVFSVADALSISTSLGTINDTMSFSDSINFGYLIERIFSDNIGFNDGYAYDFSTNLVADSINFTDGYSQDFTRALDTDGVNFTDSMSQQKSTTNTPSENQGFTDSLVLGTNQLSATVYSHSATSINLTSLGVSGWHKSTDGTLNGGTRMTSGTSITVTEYDPSSIVVPDFENKNITFTGTNPSISSVVATRMYKLGTSPNEYGFYVSIPISIFTKRIRVYVMSFKVSTNTTFKFFANLANGVASPITIYPTVTVSTGSDVYWVLDVTASSISSTNLNIWWTAYNINGDTAQSAMHYQATVIGN